MSEIVQEPVNRTRRFRFIAIVEAVAIGNIMMLAYFGEDGQLTLAAIDAFTSLAVGVALAYVGGSAVDYASSMMSGRARTYQPQARRSPDAASPAEGSITL